MTVDGSNSLSENFVPGDGNIESGVFVIGEAPGADEDRELRPFVGRSGRLLRAILTKNGLDDVYITNIVKSRPPGNRTPTAAEIQEHLPHLYDEIRRGNPRFVLLLGNTALSTLTWWDGSIMTHRGKLGKHTHVFPFDTVVFATVHPSFALRGKTAQNIMERDIEQFAQVVHQSVHDTPEGRTQIGEEN